MEEDCGGGQGLTKDCGAKGRRRGKLYASQNIIWAFRSRRKRWAVRVARVMIDEKSIQYFGWRT
jgi:hypothetical protein